MTELLLKIVIQNIARYNEAPPPGGRKRARSSYVRTFSIFNEGVDAYNWNSFLSRDCNNMNEKLIAII